MSVILIVYDVLKVLSDSDKIVFVRRIAEDFFDRYSVIAIVIPL